VPTFIASVYGMNFEHMPELKWRIGYPLALLTMLAAVLVLYRFFKRVGWLS
jgi:magnesium transporter